MIRLHVPAALLTLVMILPPLQGLARPLHETVSAGAEEVAGAGAVRSEQQPDKKTLCDLVEAAAAQHKLPVAFFARLIRAESSFRTMVVSPKGAAGIAQFMPGTAADRGLTDPFDPNFAIPASAAFLAELKGRFRNLGLAAAAYNAGPNRVARWIAEGTHLPLETRNYVHRITGRTPEDWRDGAADDGKGDETDCLTIASGAGAALAAPAPQGTQSPQSPQSPGAPWGVQLAGNYSLAVAMSSFRLLQLRYPAVLGSVVPMVVERRVGGRGPRTFYRLQVPAQTRHEASGICRSLRRKGGDCLVQKTGS